MVASARPSASGMANRAAEKAMRRSLAAPKGAADPSATAGGRRRAALVQALRSTEAQENSSQCTTLLSTFQLLLCLLLAGVNSALRSVSHYLLYFGVSLSAVGCIIMTLSFCYFVPRAVCGGRSSWLQRLNGVVVFAGWLVIVGSLVCVAVPSLGLAEVGGLAFAGTYAFLILCSLPHCLSRGAAERA